MKIVSDRLVYSPSDLVRYLESPFSSWMDRYHLENPGALKPDELSEDAKLIIETGIQHERNILAELKGSGHELREIEQNSSSIEATRKAFGSRVPIVYQAKLEAGDFAGYADFIILDDEIGRYQIWDTKLARSPKPYYAIQLCCYSEMFAEMTGEPIAEKFGIILGADENGVCERVELRTEDFIHYYRHLKDSFLSMQNAFDGDMERRPIPDPRADHGRWQSYADAYLDERDHLVRVAGISTGQIKKLCEAGISTLADLAGAADRTVPKMPRETFDKLVHQARLQKETRDLRKADKNATARFDLLATQDETGRLVGLGALPPAHPADVSFDMEGYPLTPGGLEYLFGNTTMDPETGAYEFTDFWAHDRTEEKKAFEDFIDWVHARWLANPGMHIYHYAPYEVTAVRNLSNRHATRGDEVDNLLRHEVLVDLYKIVRRGLRIGEESYSLKKVERLYDLERTGMVTMSIGSVVHYARWMQSEEPREWKESPTLKEIRDYNKDDCDSTAELAKWLRKLAADNGIPPAADDRALRSAEQSDLRPVSEVTAARLEVARQLAEKGDDISKVLSTLIDFHRREDKPVWWKFFDRADAEPEKLRDDNGCIANVQAVGEPVPEKRSLVQEYLFDPNQECKLAAGGRVAFSHDTGPKFTIFELDLSAGRLKLKAGPQTLAHFDGRFPAMGSLIPDEIVNSEPIPTALCSVAESHLAGSLNPAAMALLSRSAPQSIKDGSSLSTEEAVEAARAMDGECLVIQGPPGTGKTYTASHMIAALLADGKRVGVTSNGHKAVVNLLRACGKTVRNAGGRLVGVKVGDEGEGELFDENPDFAHVKNGGDSLAAFSEGVIGGTSWVFSRDDWENQLDYLFVDEAGQVPLANVIAMSRSTRNLVLLGDQMQLEQPTQGAHPGDARLSALQYALKDVENSSDDVTVFHAVIPSAYGIFLGESRRMHPSVCQFISESVYEGRLGAFAACSNQKIDVTEASALVPCEHGIVFSGLEHDGNVQQCEDEAERVREIFDELLGRTFTASDGTTRPLGLSDFLFIAPYNAQVRCLQAALPDGARVGSVDKFQGQEAPVCILSLCSSFGEYGSRGLGFILDQNRINVAISRAQCLAVVVGDPRIANTPASSLAEMKLLNLYCKLLKVGIAETRLAA
jgi:uncharacterized protein